MTARTFFCGLLAATALVIAPETLPAEGAIPNGLDPEGFVAANDARENLGRIDP